MELHILLAGVEFGPYTDDKARQLLGEGFLSSSDPAKRLHETDWLPLSEVLGELPEVPPAPPAKASARLPAYEEFAPLTFEDAEPEENAPAQAETPEIEAVAEETSEPVPPAPEPVAQETPSATAPAPVMSPTIPPPPAAVPISIQRTPAPAATVPAAPKLQISMPSRGKKGAMRTGSLLAKEALQAAALERSSLLGPTRPLVAATTTAPVPELEPEPAPPRKRTPVKLRETEEPAVQAPSAPVAPPSPTASSLLSTPRKTIKLSGRVGMPGIAPRPDLPVSGLAPARPATSRTTTASTRTTTAPRLPASELAKFSGFIARPSETAKKAPEPAPERASAPLQLRERKESEAAKAPARKTIRLSGPISLPDRLTGPTPPVVRAPQTEDEDGPMVMARTTRPPRISAPLPTPAPEAVEAETPPIPDPAPAAPQLAGAASLPPSTETPPEPEPTPVAEKAEPPRRIPPLVRGAEMAAAAALSAETDMRSEVEGSEAEPGEMLSASGALLSTGELAERRSLKITGTLRPPPPGPIPIQLSSPSSESGPLAPTYVPPPLEPMAEKRPAPPVPEEEIERPPTGKIAVSQMPNEGLKVRTRRLTSKVPLSSDPAESLAHESPARPAPPPLPQRKIELPVGPSLLASAPAPSPEPPLPPPGEPMTREEFVASPAAAESGMAPMPLEAPAEPAAEALAEPPDAAAKPDKVRLRRPVKLELTSRKTQDSGRLTLEAFSKLSPAAVPAAVTAAAAAFPIPAVKTEPESVPADASAAAAESASALPPEKTAPAPLKYPKKLEEADAPTGFRRKDSKGPALEWMLYSIIAVGAVAACVVAYLVFHRSSPPAPETATETPAASQPTVPASAAPPSVPTAAAPPAPAATTSATNVAPAPAPSTATNTTPAPTQPAPTNTPAATPPVPAISDLQRQAAAFVSDGILKYQRNDADGAIAAYNQALDLDPRSADAYYNRGIAKASHDDLDGAIADYSQALQVDPNRAAAYYYRGVARHTKGDLDGALSDYNQAVRMDPKNALAFFNRGLIRMQKDDIDGAIVDSTRTIELDPHQIPAYYDRGLGRLAKGAMDAALADMKLFTQLSPQSDFTDYARLYIWLIETRAGQLAEANQELSAAMNSGWNGKNDAMVTRIGEYLLGQISETELIQASASTVPTKDQGQRCEAWYFIGMRKLVAGDRDAAIEALRKCVATQKLDYCEYILAQEELKSLPGGASEGGTPAPMRATPVTLPDPGTVTPSTNTTP